ncbi:MarR family winged helix-turn-helix transcriptional regulator [Oceanobacillus chungangensis]|uniref:MarR family transcriptional regulator n=1 Tax=Oceanobacillus chungangensis TaxID=1229152 RepID=A0A3D8PNF1_9BACI|nr:MarR family transcriptional regulator [Oceanobacillus chungangensis]RDW16665.1 MarR family transcriptional regulator [Oceanobacillus chungangensis]
MEQSLFFQKNLQFSRSFTKRLNERLIEIGLYYSQWSIVYCLKQIGPVTLVEISNHLDVEKPTVSRTVKRLADQQLIEEVPSKDKRERMIQLTEKGMEVYKQAILIVRDFEKSLIEDIPQSDIDTAFRTIQLLKEKL